MSNKYILYARKSTEESDRQIQSIEDQVTSMSEVAKRLGIEIVETILESKSAKQPYNRPGFSRMLEMIENNKVDGILCWQLNRLSRNPAESGLLQQYLQDGKLCAIQTSDRVYRPEDNALIFSVEAGMNTQFVRDLMKNVRRGMHAKAEKGWLPHIPPIGYLNDRENKTIIPDPERFPLVRKMWDRMLSGTYTVSEIVRISEEELGLTTKQRKRRGGKPLSNSGGYALLQNPFYFGQFMYGGTMHKGKHTPMVSEAEFLRVQSLIKRRDAPRPSVETGNDPFTYRGLIKCGECGCAITYTKKVRNYKNGSTQEFEYLYCTNRRKDFECSQRGTIKPEALTEQIKAALSDYTIMDEFFKIAVSCLDKYIDSMEDKNKDIRDIKIKKIKTLEDELSGLRRMLYSGRCDEQFFDLESKKLENELKLLKVALNNENDSNVEWRKQAFEAFSFARYAKEDFDSDSLEKKRKVLVMLSENLLLLDGKLVFQPMKYLVPIKKVSQFESSVVTSPEQRKTPLNEGENSLWCSTVDEVVTLLIEKI